MFPFPDRRTEAVLVIIDAVAFELFVAERQRRLASRPEIDRGIIFVGDDLVENTADLQAGRVFAGRDVLAFDGFVNAFESADHERHLVRKFFKHVSEMFEIATNEKLRLLGRDIERHIRRVDGVGNLLHLRLET